ncbi:hypothetical protein BASA60_007332 [Batrachochytrium salamandrivorans]|nr:hypothetical protein BASA60_007332 [Batrachochytrium salamandrivorans]
MRSTDSDRSVRATPKKARDASPPPQDDLWVVVKNLSQQVCCSAGRDGCFAQHYCSPAEGNSQPGENPQQLGESHKNMAAVKSTSEATQTALAAILARLEVGPVVPQVVVQDNDYPPLPPTGATPKRKTMATKPNYGLAAVSITYLRSILAPILGHQMEHVSKIDRRTTKHAPRAPKQANPLAYSAKLPTSPSRPDSTNSPTSTTITADPRSQCCQHQQQTSCYPPYRQEHQALGHLRDLHHLIQILLYCPWIRCHPASAIYDAVDCLKCPTALLQFCDIALDDGPLRPASSTGITDMAISAPDTTTKRGSTAARSKKAASIKRGDSSTAPISNSAIGSRKKTREEEDKQIGSTSAVRRPYRTSKKPANTLATAGDTMPTEDELKVMTYIASSLRMVPHSSELFSSYSTNLTCLPGNNRNSSTMDANRQDKGRDGGSVANPEWSGALKLPLGADGEAGGDHLRRTLMKLFKLFGSLWEFYFPLVDDISQRNSGRSRCNARSDLGLALCRCCSALAILTASKTKRNKRAATELTDSDNAAPKRLCKS